MSEKVIGGLADGIKDSAFNQKNLKKGMKVEREHTKSKAIAKEIAKDHLKEDPEYYQKLQKMEKEGGVAMPKARAQRLAEAVVHRAKLTEAATPKVHGLIRRIEQDPYTSSIGLVHALRGKISKGGDPKAISKLESLVKRIKER